jgi:hypothetical protein
MRLIGPGRQDRFSGTAILISGAPTSFCGTARSFSPHTHTSHLRVTRSPLSRPGPPGARGIIFRGFRGLCRPIPERLHLSHDASPQRDVWPPLKGPRSLVTRGAAAPTPGVHKGWAALEAMARTKAPVQWERSWIRNIAAVQTRRAVLARLESVRMCQLRRAR